MMDIMAQVNWEQAGTMIVVVIMALGGQKGLEALIIAWRGKPARGNGANGKYVPSDLCTLRHQELETRQKERHQTVLSAIADVQRSIRGLNERIDKIHD